MKLTPEIRRLVARPFATRAEAVMAAQLAADLRGMCCFARKIGLKWHIRWSAPYYDSTEIRIMPQRR